jgi:glycosyltransferase involved in cell wall biosynthesis
MKRILHIVPDMRSGGLETLIMNIYRNIDRTKIQFDFLVHYRKLAFYDEEIEALGGQIYRLSFREDNHFLGYLKDLNDFFSQHDEYDVVHGHMASLAFIYLKYACKYGINTRIIHSHNTDTEKTLKGYIKRYLIKFSSYYANVCFACSEEAGKFLFGNKEFKVINNGIISSKFKYNEKIRSTILEKYNAQDKFVVGHIGRFCKQKNHRFLVDIFSCVKEMNDDSELWLIGDGELKEDIQNYVQKLGLENCVKFLGIKKNVEEFYQGMDVFVLPSLFEGLGIVNIEAQTSGLKCVLSDQVPSIVDVTGNVEFVSLNKTKKEWADIIVKNISYDRKDCQKKVINAGFDIEAEAMKIQEFYFNSKFN